VLFHKYVQLLSVPDPAPFFGESLFRYLHETGVLLKLIPETIGSKKKVYLVLLPPFYIGLSIRRPG
jgi:hypothetical protein